MRQILTSEQMYACDRHTMEELGVPSRVLMERAAHACCDSMIRMLDGQQGRVLVCCGGGNNGGDGYAMARFLHEAGYDCDLCQIAESGHFSVECARQRELALESGLCEISLPLSHDDRIKYIAAADALFGIGLSRGIPAESKAGELIAWLNASGLPILSVDIPSGVFSDTGEIPGIAVHAVRTVTISNPKHGLMRFPGFSCVGELETADIGIPCIFPAAETELLADRSCFDTIPLRWEDGNKGSFGRLLVIAGSVSMSGAAYLCGLGAYRVGAGLVRILTPSENRVILQTSLPEAILTTYDAENPDLDAVRSALSWADAVVIGPGLGTSGAALAILRTVLEDCRVPLLMDADACNLTASNKLPLPSSIPLILTPHPGEFSRLTGISAGTLLSDLAGAARSFAREHSCILVAKDAHSVVSDGENAVRVVSGCSALAKGGSGDVLAGIIGGLLVSGTAPFDAAVSGSYLHGLAGTRCAVKYGRRGVLAHEVADAAAELLREVP